MCPTCYPDSQKMARQTSLKSTLRILTVMPEELVRQYNEAQQRTTTHKVPYYSKSNVASIRKAFQQRTRCLTNTNLT